MRRPLAKLWCTVPQSLLATVTQFVPHNYQFVRSLQRKIELTWFNNLHVAEGLHGEVFVSDATQHRVHTFSEGGVFLRQWGSHGTATGQFRFPVGIAVVPKGTGPREGEVVVIDSSNHRVQVFRPDGTFLRMWGSFGTDDGQLMYPHCVAVTHGVGPSGEVEVLVIEHRSKPDFHVFRLSDGAFLRKWGMGRSLFLAVTLCGNKVLVTNYTTHCVQMLGLDGLFLRQWGCFGKGPGQFAYPSGVATNANEVLVVDSGNHRVQVFRWSDGAFVRTWGSSGVGNCQFQSPSNLVVTRTGHVLVCDNGNARVQVFQ